MTSTTTSTTDHNDAAAAAAASGAGIEAQRAKVGFTFREDMAPGLVLEMELKSILHSTRSLYQQIDVIDTVFGKTLITDGKTQSAQFDEFAYHESLVHPAMLHFAHHNNKSNENENGGPKRVFIGGGGELATAREVLRHPSVEKVVMVDLDEAVVNVSVEHLPEWGGLSVKNDPRLELIIGDAYAWLSNCTERFDVIILDISDPIEAGPGIMLYTKELYQHAASILSDSGVFVTQAGSADAIPPPHAINVGGSNKDTTCFGPIRNTLAEVFPTVMPYTQAVPSFGNDWGFVMASKVSSNENNDNDNHHHQDWKRMAPNTIDTLIDTYIEGGERSLRMYDGICHMRMFALSKALRHQLMTDTRIMTKDNPIFMY